MYFLCILLACAKFSIMGLIYTVQEYSTKSEGNEVIG